MRRPGQPHPLPHAGSSRPAADVTLGRSRRKPTVNVVMPLPRGPRGERGSGGASSSPLSTAARQCLQNRAEQPKFSGSVPGVSGRSDQGTIAASGVAPGAFLNPLPPLGPPRILPTGADSGSSVPLPLLSILVDLLLGDLGELLGEAYKRKRSESSGPGQIGCGGSRSVMKPAYSGAGGQGSPGGLSVDGWSSVSGALRTIPRLDTLRASSIWSHFKPRCSPATRGLSIPRRPSPHRV
jgi:hypothetical protein